MQLSVVNVFVVNVLALVKLHVMLTVVLCDTILQVGEVAASHNEAIRRREMKDTLMEIFMRCVDV